MSNNDFLKSIKGKVQSIVSKYEEQLASKGIAIDVSKKYYETVLYHFNRRGGLLEIIDTELSQKREGKYKNIRNRYHSIVISVLPIDRKLVKREHCREYAFLLRSIDREEIGRKPKLTEYNIEKVLYKIEKRILRLLKKADKKSAEKVCKDSFVDAFRYTLSGKYRYKKRILGLNAELWSVLSAVFIVVIILLILVMIALLKKS